MPEDADTTAPGETTTGDVPPVETPALYEFPFTIPGDLAAVSDEDLRALHTQVREHARSFTGLSPAETTEAALTGLRACRDLAVDVADELRARPARAAEAAALADELAAADIEDLTGDPPPADPTPPPADPPPPAPPAPTAVTAAGRRANPRAREVARPGNPPSLPSDAGTRSRFGTMTAAADVPNFPAGAPLEKFADAARAIAARVDQYPQMSAQRAQQSGKRRPVTAYVEGEPGRRLTLKQFVRHSGVQLNREFPDELRVRDGDGDRGYAVAEYAAQERRLPGGNLIRSAELAVKAGRSLTAAAGWCAPSETLYDLLELETLDGILDTPEMQTTRGGWNIPINGGPDFSTIYDAIGSSGDTHLTEAEVEADTLKVATEIPCPPFEEVRLGVDYYILTGGLLQRRGYPEVVGRWSRGAAVALAHKINFGYIAAIVAGSTNAGTIPADPSGDDAASALLAAVELAIVDAKYRHRMAMGSGTMEAVFPWWVLVPIRAALSRRTGVALMDVTDAQILGWFTMRGAVPRFVYDWQDAFSGLPTGPGGATALRFLPSTVQFVVYPAGTWVKAVQDVVALDTIYDSTLLQTNQYTAVMAEDGWAALKMAPLSRLYTVAVDPSGVTGCCPTLVS